MVADQEPGAQPEEPGSSVSLSRRRFLVRMNVLLGGVGAALVGIPVVGFLLGPLLRRVPDAWRPVGAVDAFQIGQTVPVSFLDLSSLRWAGVTAKTAVWLRRESEQEFVAFAINCTHLGCPVRWIPEARLFICPCHGGTFDQDGAVAAGPPPRPLTRYEVRVRDGQVEVLAGPVPIVG